MLKGIPKSEYPRLLYRYVKEFFEVIKGEMSLKVYLGRNYPSLYKARLKEGEKLKARGIEVIVPRAYKYSSITEVFNILGGKYSTPECSIKAGDIVLDCGAHFGFFSYFALKKGAEKVYAFEPNPYVFEILKKNVGLWDPNRIEPVNLALWFEKGNLDLRIERNRTGPGATILTDLKGTFMEKAGNEYSEIVKVKTTTIDHFVKEKGLSRVDFIKIDTEGAERGIIKGAKETIRRFKPKIVVSAYHFHNDTVEIPELVLSIRGDYRFKLVGMGDEDLIFW